jgi:hypothetical protein
MRRVLWITLAVAALALGATATATAATQAKITVCVTSLAGFSNADLNALDNQGVNAGTITDTFELPPGLATQVIQSGDGFAGPCTVEGSSGGGGGGGGGGSSSSNVCGDKCGTPFVKAPETINLCYSIFQVDPGQWGQPQASQLFALGYWQPYAVKANIGVTVIGDYHFICNLPAGYAVTTPAQWVDEGGLIVDANKAGVGVENGGYARIAASA